MFYRKIIAALLLTACLSGCTKGSSADDETVFYWDAEGNPITFNDTVGQGYATSIAESDLTETQTLYEEASAETTEEAEETEQESGDDGYCKPQMIDKAADELIRSDYAAYVSSRDGTDVYADDVHGVFNYGTDNGYMLLVMCPSEAYTCDIKIIELPCMDMPEDDCDCYPFKSVELPSGSYEMYAYKDSCFYPITDALSNKLISYDTAYIISDYTHEGNTECVYTVE